MLRRTAQRAMVPFHPIIPGKPSVRGMLYRPSHMNMYSRLSMIAIPQRTEEENRIFRWIVHPEVFMFTTFVGAALMYMGYILLFDVEIGQRIDKHRRNNYEGMESDEVFKRNWEMHQIFEQHRDLVAETRKRYVPERPAVFDPPESPVRWNDPLKDQHRAPTFQPVRAN